MGTCGNFDGFQEGMNPFFPDQYTEQFQASTIWPPNQIRAEGVTVDGGIQSTVQTLVEAVRMLQASIPALVEGGVRTELQASLPGLVEEAVKRKFGESIPKLVEPLKKAVQASNLALADEVKGMIQTSQLQSSTLPSSSRSLPHQAESSESRRLHLKFIGVLPDKLVTMNNIQDEGASLSVELCDASGHRVDVGPESSAKIKIVPVDGDFKGEDSDNWTNEDFKKYIVEPRADKGPLLKGKHEISLSKGIVSVSDIAFTDNSKSVRNGNFRLGAHVLKEVPGVTVRAAVSDPFRVKERRVKSYGKHENPSLDDEVWHLVNIGKNGTIHKRLTDAKVYTVKDFLHYTDEKALKNMFKGEKKWKQAIEQAKTCAETSRTQKIVVSSGEEEVDILGSISYESRGELIEKFIQTSQMSIPAEPSFPSITQQMNMQCLDSTVANQGEETFPPYGFLDDFQTELSNHTRTVPFNMQIPLSRNRASTNQTYLGTETFWRHSPNMLLDGRAADQGRTPSQGGGIGELSVYDYGGFEGGGSNLGVLRGTAMRRTKCFSAKWHPILSVLKFRIAFKIRTKRGPRVLKRQKLC